MKRRTPLKQTLRYLKGCLWQRLGRGPNLALRGAGPILPSPCVCVWGGSVSVRLCWHWCKRCCIFCQWNAQAEARGLPGGCWRGYGFASWAGGAGWLGADCGLLLSMGIGCGSICFGTPLKNQAPERFHTCKAERAGDRAGPATWAQPLPRRRLRAPQGPVRGDQSHQQLALMGLDGPCSANSLPLSVEPPPTPAKRQLTSLCSLQILQSQMEWGRLLVVWTPHLVHTFCVGKKRLQAEGPSGASA